MASILRTGKFLRYFAGITRNMLVNPVRDTEVSNLLSSTTCMCGQFQSSAFANNAATKPQEQMLDHQLRRLDQDVRRIGRISRRDLEEVLEEIRTQRSATSSQSLLIIRCCGNLVPEELPELRTTLVQEIWKTLRSLNVPMDISHYNALLRVYLENEHPFAPTDFLTEIEANGIEPNRVTYQRLIARYCQTGDIDGATRILEFMRAKNLSVNENVFNSLILGHSQANDLESARGILTVMKQAGLEPSAETYSTLLSCYARHGDLDAINNVLAECEQKDVYLLAKDVLDVVYILAINGHSEQIDPVLENLRGSMTGFNQDAVNIILRLVNKGYEDVGLKVLRRMPRSLRPDGQPVDAGSFFIRQMVKANRPIENILRICKTLQDEDLNNKALLIATEAGLLNNGALSNTLPLLQALKTAGLPIRQHYFWPLICSAESNQIMDILRCMQNDFSIHPNSETLRDYVIPNLKDKNLDRVVMTLRDVGISSATAAASVAYVALIENQMRNAANIMETYRSNYLLILFKQPLVLALSKTNDYTSFVRIVRQLHESVLYRSQASPSKSSSSKEPSIDTETAEEIESTTEYGDSGATTPVQDVVGTVLNEAITYFRTNRIELLEKLLPALVEQGLSISSANATRISERLGSSMTTQFSELLGKLSSGELEPKPLPNVQKPKRGVETLTIEEMERFIANVEAKGDNANSLKRHLLSSCFRSRSVEKTLSVIEKLEDEKYTIPTGVWAQLIELYTHHDKVDEAMGQYEKVKTKEPEFLLDNLKTLKLVEALVKAERIDDAVKFLERNKKSEPFADTENSSFIYMNIIWRILNSLADEGDEQKLQTVFNAIIDNNYALPTNVILGPLIKVHLVRDDIEKALTVFEQLCAKYKSTPWKNELACRLIQKEDATNLQRLTDLSTDIHGEVNSLYDLVFSFVECGRVRQARKILETPGLRTRPQRIESACDRYRNEGKEQPLEGLIDATRDLNHIDRNKIYYSLLLSYSKSENTDKAVGLWTKMQEEDFTPTDAFLIKLAEMLEKKNLPVPFVVPNTVSTPKSAKKEKTATLEKTIVATATQQKTTVVKRKENVTKSPSTLSLFRKALRDGEIDEAIIRHEQLKADEAATITDISHLIEHLVRVSRLTEATKYVDKLISEGHYPLPKIFKFYLNKIAASGDVDYMKRLGSHLSPEQKRLFSFDNRFCHANIVSGKIQQYLKDLGEEVAAAKTDEEVAKLAAKFPRGGAVGILSRHPECEAKFQQIAEKYATHNQLGPINVLWMHLVTSGNEAAAKVIWNKHLSNAPRLMFQRVLQTAREQKDPKLAGVVIEQLRDSKISEGAIGNAYSCLIDIQNGAKDFDKALETVKTAVKDVCLENINRTALLHLKEGLESQKKEFPFTIPEKRNSKHDTSSSSSSISSDDDVTPKRPETKPAKPNKRSESD